MIAQTIINKVRRQLLETIGTFWSDAELLDLINEAELDFHNRIRLLEASALMSTQIGRYNYPLPSNWLSSRALLLNKLNSDGTDNWHRLQPTNLEKITQEKVNFLSTNTNQLNTPYQYFIWNKEIWLYPVPDDVYTVQMFFKSKPVPITVLTESLNTDDSLSEAIEAYVLWKAWKKEKEQDLALEQAQMYSNYIREARRWEKKQSGDQRFKLDIESKQGFNMGGGWNFPPLT